MNRYLVNILIILLSILIGLALLTGCSNVPESILPTVASSSQPNPTENPIPKQSESPTFSNTPKPPLSPVLPWSTIENILTTSPIIPPPFPTMNPSNQDLISKSLVQVWGIGYDHTTGLIVGDGNQVLTAWNFEDWKPTTNFIIAVPGGRTFKAQIQAFDSRNSLLLLKADDMNLSHVSLDKIPNLTTGQNVIVHGWNLHGEFITVPMVMNTTPSVSARSFSIGYPPEAIQNKNFTEIWPGAVITDQQESFLGMVGVFYNDTILAAHPHSSSLLPQIAPIASINSTKDLFLLDAPYQRWANYPLQAVIWTNVITDISTRFSESDNMISQALSNLETQLGSPLPDDELKGYQRQVYPDYDGSVITVIYSFRVILLSSEGGELAKAKWVGIQWDRKNNAPNRLFYGDDPQTVKGGFYLAGDITSLSKGIENWLPAYKGSDGKVTVTAPASR